MIFVEEQATLRLTLNNGSDAIAQNVVLTYTLPASFTYNSSDPAGVANGQVISFTFPAISPQAEEIVDVLVTPTLAGTFTSAAEATSDNTIVGTPEDEYEHEVFDRRPCQVLDIADGGGNTFDCLPDGTYTGIPLVGTGFTVNYGADGINRLRIEPFEDYANGAYVGGTPGATVDGFDQIYVGDGP